MLKTDLVCGVSRVPKDVPKHLRWTTHGVNFLKNTKKKTNFTYVQYKHSAARLTKKIMRSRSGNVVNFKVFHLIDPTVSTSLILLAPRGGYLAHCADVSCSDSTRDRLVLIIGKGQGECKIGT